MAKFFASSTIYDIVPHVPPPLSLLNLTRFYGHFGKIKYFNARGMIVANYRLTARLLDAAAIGFIKGLFDPGLDLINDHRMEYYISHLNMALRQELEDQASQMLDTATGTSPSRRR